MYNYTVNISPGKIPQPRLASSRRFLDTKAVSAPDACDASDACDFFRSSENEWVYLHRPRATDATSLVTRAMRHGEYVVLFSSMYTRVKNVSTNQE